MMRENSLNHNVGMTHTVPPDLGALFEEHVAHEFVTKDVDAYLQANPNFTLPAPGAMPTK